MDKEEHLLEIRRSVFRSLMWTVRNVTDMRDIFLMLEEECDERSRETRSKKVEEAFGDAAQHANGAADALEK